MSVVRFRPEAPTHAGVAQLAEQLICNQQVVGSIPITSSNANTEPFSSFIFHTGRFQSGQMDQTVNLTSTTSVVRIYLFPPPKGDTHRASPFVLREEVIEVCRRSVVRASGIGKKFCSTLPCSSRAAPLCRGDPSGGGGNIHHSLPQRHPIWVPLRRRSRSPLPLRRHAAWLFGTSPARPPWPTLPKHPPDRFLSATDAPRKSENGTP